MGLKRSVKRVWPWWVGLVVVLAWLSGLNGMTESERAEVPDLYGPVLLALDLALLGCAAMLVIRYWQRHKAPFINRGGRQDRRRRASKRC